MRLKRCLASCEGWRKHWQSEQARRYEFWRHQQAERASQRANEAKEWEEILRNPGKARRTAGSGEKKHIMFGWTTPEERKRRWEQFGGFHSFILGVSQQKGRRVHRDPDGHYEVLGISPEAPQEEIERAYRERVMQSHPDQAKHRGSTNQLKRVLSAGRLLRSPTRRAKYDAGKGWL